MKKVERRIYYDPFLGIYNPQGWTVRTFALMYVIGFVGACVLTGLVVWLTWPEWM